MEWMKKMLRSGPLGGSGLPLLFLRCRFGGLAGRDGLFEDGDVRLLQAGSGRPITY